VVRIYRDDLLVRIGDISVNQERLRLQRYSLVMTCPDAHCGSANAEQRLLTEGELEAAGFPEWGSAALRCSYCGAVYTQDVSKPIIHGHFAGMFLGWQPAP
jgi:uncharacterized Zn finger protein